MLILVQPNVSEQPDGFLAHVEAIGALPELIAARFWERVKLAEDLGEEIIGGENECFVLSSQYSQSLQTLLIQLQAKYATVAEWLKYYLCNSQQNDLFHSEKIHYKPFAKYLIARLKLCQEVYPKAIELQSLLSPADWWVNWMLSELWLEFYQLFQGELGYQGKREWYNLARQASKSYEVQHEGNSIPRPRLLQPSATLPANLKRIAPALLAIFLEELCASEASADPTFDREHYQKYLREQRVFHNACRNSPHLQVGCISSDGQFRLSHKSKQVSESRRRKL